MGPITLVTLIAHRIPTLKPCNRTSGINVGFSADQYLLFWGLTTSLEMKPSFVAKWMRMGSVSPSCTTWRYQFTKFSLDSRSVSQCSWNAVVLHRRKYNGFVATRVDDAGTPLCCASRNIVFVEDVSNLALISSGFCAARVIFLSRIELFAWNCSCILSENPFHVSDMRVREVLSEFTTPLVGLCYLYCTFSWLYKIVIRQMYTLYYLLFNAVYIQNSPTCFELCYSSSSGTQLFITSAIGVWYSLKYIS
jgi:hypothetical protein